MVRIRSWCKGWCKGWCMGLGLCIVLSNAHWLTAQSNTRQAPTGSQPGAQRSADKSASKEPESRSLDLPSEKATDKKVDVKTEAGKGGETHQQATDKDGIMATDHGVPISDNQNTLRQGARGPALLEDFAFREKLFRFDHERIPERVVHARGFGVHGYFETYESLKDITKADIFQRAGEKTPVFVRFSTVAGSKGSPDLARDVRGFAVKLYTKEGNWDIVGNNIPVFFIQDPMKFPDLVHAAKPEPDRGFPQAQTAHDTFWDFISLTPESMNMVMWIMSDRTIPRSFRFMEGFGVHTFRLVNAEGKSTFVKFHWKPKLGLQSVVWNEAVKINGADPDYHRRDLWNSIEGGNYPEWELGLQLFDQEFADKFEFDILDSTKIIPEELVPIRKVGRMVLDRTVDNFFNETEQVAFCTQNVVPGVDFTNDPLLQGRNFSYLDTQLKRLGGPNFAQLPINAPRCPVHNFLQDGHMNFRNPKGRINYEPNSFGVGPRENHDKGFESVATEAEGKKVRERPETFSDHYSQARQFYISQTDVEQEHIANALIFELSKVESVDIRSRMVGHLLNIDDELAKDVAEGLGLIEMPKAAQAARETNRDLKESPALSILKSGPKSFAGRTVGVLVSEGFPLASLRKLSEALKEEGANMKLVAPHVGAVKGDDGKAYRADEKIDGGPSVLFDAVVLLVTEDGLKPLADNPATRDFVADAIAHHKFIGHTAAAKQLVEMAGGKPDEGQLVSFDGDASMGDFIKKCRQLRTFNK